jgi:tetraacyldisaccharide 4'-kinase
MSSDPSRLQAAWLTRGAIARLLLPLAALFGALTALRAGLYRSGWLRTHRLPAPVIVVGNLIVGGAGKTPCVIAIADALRQRGHRPGIVSRGYGRSARDVVDVQPDTPTALCGDEPLLLRLRTRVPVVVAQDRVAAGRTLLRGHPEVDVIVSDDGLQHLRLARQAQVLVFDDRGVGNGWLLPAGPLREPLPRAVPPRTLVLYNAAQASTPLPGHLSHRALAGVAALEAWWAGAAPSRAALEALNDRRVVAAAGLARPERFFDLLRAAGLTIDALPLPDHHDFATLPWPRDATDVIVTEKDAVKLRPERTAPTRVWVAALDFTVGSAFFDALLALLPQPGPLNPKPTTDPDARTRE